MTDQPIGRAIGGKKGGAATSKRHGKEHYQRIGSMGGKPNRIASGPSASRTSLNWIRKFGTSNRRYVTPVFRAAGSGQSDSDPPASLASFGSFCFGYNARSKENEEWKARGGFGSLSLLTSTDWPSARA